MTTSAGLAAGPGRFRELGQIGLVDYEIDVGPEVATDPVEVAGVGWSRQQVGVVIHRPTCRSHGSHGRTGRPTDLDLIP